jgi:hypothetical protein
VSVVDGVGRLLARNLDDAGFEGTRLLVLLGGEESCIDRVTDCDSVVFYGRSILGLPVNFAVGLCRLASA